MSPIFVYSHTDPYWTVWYLKNSYFKNGHSKCIKKGLYLIQIRKFKLNKSHIYVSSKFVCSQWTIMTWKNSLWGLTGDEWNHLGWTFRKFVCPKFICLWRLILTTWLPRNSHSENDHTMYQKQTKFNAELEIS